MEFDKIIPWVSLVLAVVTFFIGRFSAHQANGEKSGTIASDIGYIKAGIDDLKSELRMVKAELNEMATRLAKVEESTKSAHKRIDEIVHKEGG